MTVKLPEFYSVRGLTEWDCAEIHPVAEVEPGVFEQVDEDHDFWSVYLHTKEGLVCVADVKTKKQAEQLARIIEKAAKHFKDCSRSSFFEPEPAPGPAISRRV